MRKGNHVTITATAVPVGTAVVNGNKVLAFLHAPTASAALPLPAREGALLGTRAAGGHRSYGVALVRLADGDAGVFAFRKEDVDVKP